MKIRSLTAAAVLLFAAHASAQMINDGSFQATSPDASYTSNSLGAAPTTINAWMFGSTGGHAGTVAPLNVAPNSGVTLKSASTSTPGDVFVEQTISGFTVGDSYTVLFTLSAVSGTVTVTIGSSTTPFTGVTSPTPETVTFTATGASQTLAFTSDVNHSATFSLTGVSIAVTPEPNSVFAMTLVFAGVCCLERKRIGGALRSWACRLIGRGAA
jgi:hypothetical protein